VLKAPSMLTINPKRILIVKPSSLGDIIHALPTLVALRTQFPEAWIAWVVKQEWAEILEGHPCLNEVISEDFSFRHLWRLSRRIRKKAFDVVVDLQGLFRSALLGKLSGASYVIGFAQGRELSPWFYTHRVELPIPPGQSWRLWEKHAVDRNLSVAKFLGAECRHADFWLPCLKEDQQEIDHLLKTGGVTQTDRLVALAPLTRQSIKNWPVERFLQVAQALIKIDRVKVLLIGTENPTMSREFESCLGSRLVDLMGKTRVRQLGVLFDKVELLIANDSAPLHIAAARGTPILTLFGPTNPAATGPYQLPRGSQVLTRSLPCRPCGERTCHNPNSLECLTSISVQEVMRHAEEVLSATVNEPCPLEG